MKDYVVADIKEFIESEINFNNKYLIGACYLADDNEIYTEIKVSFRTNLVGNYKKIACIFIDYKLYTCKDRFM